MAVTLATVVTYPLPGLIPARATLSGGGNYWRAWCTAAPIGSKLRNAIDQDVAARVLAAEGGTVETVQLELDVGGAYTFACQEYTKGASTYGGGYSESPDGFTTETKVGAENTQTLYVGQRLVTRMGAPGYGYADVAVHVWNATIRPTTLALHGEVTPAVVATSSPQAAVAAQNATFLTTLATMGNVAASTAIGALDTLCAELRTDIPLHFNNSPATRYHDNAGAPAPDTDNDTAIERLPITPGTPAGYVAFLNTVRDRLQRHMTNSPGLYHGLVATGPDPDYTNALLSPIPAGADMSQVLAAAADTVSRYNAHLADVTHHLNADVTNGITTALGALAQTHRDFIAALRPLSPTPPATLNSGAVALIHGAGFYERPR